MSRVSVQEVTAVSVRARGAPLTSLHALFKQLTLASISLEERVERSCALDYLFIVFLMCFSGSLCLASRYCG